MLSVCRSGRGPLICHRSKGDQTGDQEEEQRKDIGDSGNSRRHIAITLETRITRPFGVSVCRPLNRSRLFPCCSQFRLSWRQLLRGRRCADSLSQLGFLLIKLLLLLLDLC